MRFAEFLSGLLLALLAWQNVQAADTWVAEEVLRQLAEVRKENVSLRNEIEALKKRVLQLETRPGSQPIQLDDILSGGHLPLGNERAPVVMIEFSDYECPFCRKFETATLPELKQHYIDKGLIRFYIKDFPLEFHQEAKAAAAAVICAGQQQAYWEMSHRIFASQQALGRDLYLQQAVELKLDRERFSRCLESKEVDSRIQKDIADGIAAGVRATPTFLIGTARDGKLENMRAVSGALAYSRLAPILDALLKIQ